MVCLSNFGENRGLDDGLLNAPRVSDGAKSAMTIRARKVLELIFVICVVDVVNNIRIE